MSKIFLLLKMLIFPKHQNVLKKVIKKKAFANISKNALSNECRKKSKNSRIGGVER